MKHIRILLAFAVGASLAGAVAAQDGTLKKIKDSGAITVGHRDASLPFSYYDDKQQPIGYAMDLCARIVDAVKAELKMPSIKTNYQLVTSANRIPLMANGTIDLECGSTTNRHGEPLGLQEVRQPRQAREPEGQDDRLDRGHDQHQGHDRDQRGEEPRHEHHLRERPPGSFPDGRDRPRGRVRHG